ncbi:AraC family transcriptional regulator [Pseudorhodoplanes sinuspersici]|uniref:AraC family transcriptional regulator n=1 Tax=Pseudorhodoplanes sinuspersici TaxID=1235591 RepID=A0A1W6ZYP5_9HYPH|nr:AraC family transcriptional regulator [Pseudorhodoplanes sinuspersici]ARQ02453.1 AraC family transcriptional regulator [Pseudorhodoplanes sinuspersici]RKE74289.1 AraC-like DNA-binding protein [Pseudorhodoplanes sinuspersici]
MTTLLNAVRRYTDAYADPAGIARTPIPGLTAIRATAPTGLDYAIARPLVALVVQGTKHVTMGEQAFTFSAGDSLLITADVPTVSQITRASSAAPYFSLVLDLDPSVIAELTAEMKAAPVLDDGPVRVEPTDAEVTDAALRLMRLLDRPASVPVLQAQLVREMHYWLLAGRHGAAIRRLGYPDSHAQRVARAVAVLRTEFAQALPVERLAAVAGMSPSSFHQHFRAVTSLSPLQFQKQLRLIEARRLMTSEGASASSAAFAVGYESVSQFTREYGRMFGVSPVKDTKAAKSWADAV